MGCRRRRRSGRPWRRRGRCAPSRAPAVAAGGPLAARIAAIQPVAGALALGACVPARPVPILLLYGRADRVVSAALIVAARGWWARANGCGPAVTDGGCEHYTGCSADVVYCEGPEAHRWPAGATERIWRFFEAHPAA